MYCLYPCFASYDNAIKLFIDLGMVVITGYLDFSILGTDPVIILLVIYVMRTLYCVPSRKNSYHHRHRQHHPICLILTK